MKAQNELCKSRSSKLRSTLTWGTILTPRSIRQSALPSIQFERISRNVTLNVQNNTLLTGYNPSHKMIDRKYTSWSVCKCIALYPSSDIFFFFFFLWGTLFITNCKTPGHHKVLYALWDTLRKYAYSNIHVYRKFHLQKLNLLKT